MKKALLLLCIFALPALCQSTNITGIPEEAAIFKITFKPGKGPQGENVVYGAIKDSGKFLDSEYARNDSGVHKNLVVVLDSPTNPADVKVIESDIQDAQPESKSLRLKRYADAGFVVVEDRDKKEILVSSATLKRLERLAELETQRAQEADARIAPFQEYANPTENGPKKPGPLALWGPHALTLLVAGLALFGVVKTCFS